MFVIGSGVFKTSHPIEVYIIPDGATGEIYVDYSTPINNTFSSRAYAQIFWYNSSSALYMFVNPSPNLTATASPAMVSFNSNTTHYSKTSSNNNAFQSEVVTYTVEVPKNATNGIYGIYLYQFCEPFPIAVGNYSKASLSQLWNDEEKTHRCPDLVLDAQISWRGGCLQNCECFIMITIDTG